MLSFFQVIDVSLSMPAETESKKKSEHSVKLPYLYKEGSKILKAYSEKKGSLKSLVYATRCEKVRSFVKFFISVGCSLRLWPGFCVLGVSHGDSRALTLVF